jgi:hypothetical protein
MLSQDNMAP